jgi:hypothetical protein
VALVRSSQLTIVVGVVILRRTRPNMRRGFEGPLNRSHLCSAQHSALTLFLVLLDSAFALFGASLEAAAVNLQRVALGVRTPLR